MDEHIVIAAKRTTIHIISGSRADEFEQVLEAIASGEDRDADAAEDAAQLARGILDRWQSTEKGA